MLVNQIEKSRFDPKPERIAQRKSASESSFAETMQEMLTVDAVELSTPTDADEQRKQQKRASQPDPQIIQSELDIKV